MSKSPTVKQSDLTFREAYGILQKHAESLRNQREPNIDNLLTIVEESVSAYKVCKKRIDAVEQALEKALTDIDDVVNADEDPLDRSEMRPGDTTNRRPGVGPKQTSSTETQSSAQLGDLDDDIPF